MRLKDPTCDQISSSSVTDVDAIKKADATVVVDRHSCKKNLRPVVMRTEGALRVSLGRWIFQATAVSARKNNWKQQAVATTTRIIGTSSSSGRTCGARLCWSRKTLLNGIIGKECEKLERVVADSS